ncbi:MAG: hypothetical protein CNLJKLNK_00757 [Holosporales bacterium]
MRIGTKIRINPNLTGKDFVHLTLAERKYVVIFHMDHLELIKESTLQDTEGFNPF